MAAAGGPRGRVSGVAFQGEPGAYSEDAAARFFAGRSAEIRTVPCATFAEALGSTERGETDYTMLPVENSLAGSVGESIDLLYGTPLRAVGESYYKVEHCLIGTGRPDQVSTVYSHPQALGQCRRFIQGAGMKAVPTYDTAGSVRMVKGMGSDAAACIASRAAAELNGMPVMAEGIADEPGNYTRFLAMAREGGALPAPAGAAGEKTSVIFSVRHEPGALHRIVRAFHENGTSMTKIESRPRRGAPWEYNFYVDFEGGPSDPPTAAMLEGMRGDALFFKVLGTYPAARTRGP